MDEKIGPHLDDGVTGILVFGGVAPPKPVSERLSNA